jgi:anti-sigma regulatory factor (Ser/Thr protein kinase)
MSIDALLRLSADASSVREARAFVRRTLDDWALPDYEAPAVLLTSELVTNALLHASSPDTIGMRLEGGRLWIGVVDGSPVLPSPKRYPLDAGTGRGLLLVDRVAARWGVQSEDNGKTVWFELDGDSTGRFAATQDAALLGDTLHLAAELSHPGAVGGWPEDTPGTARGPVDSSHVLVHV